MSQDDKFVQFPIAILKQKANGDQWARGTQWESASDLCNTIIDVALWNLASQAVVKMEADVIDELVERYERHNNCTVRRGATSHTDSEKLAAACEYMGVNFQNAKLTTIAKRLKEDASSYGQGGTRCRIRADIMWDMRGKWPIEDVKTYIGVVAGIGRSQWKWLSYSRIRALAGGFSSVKKISGQEPSLLTLKQVRGRVDKLWMRNLFQCALDGNKRMYSIRHKDDAELAKYLAMVQPANRKELPRVSR